MTTYSQTYASIAKTTTLYLFLSKSMHKLNERGSGDVLPSSSTCLFLRFFRFLPEDFLCCQGELVNGMLRAANMQGILVRCTLISPLHKPAPLKPPSWQLIDSLWLLFKQVKQWACEVVEEIGAGFQQQSVIGSKACEIPHQ